MKGLRLITRLDQEQRGRGGQKNEEGPKSAAVV